MVEEEDQLLLKTDMKRKPEWLKVKLGTGENFTRLKRIVDEGNLHTVCKEAMCPNMGECWNHGRATLMILGQVCSRSCRFCNVESEDLLPCDEDEPRRVAEAVKQMGLEEVVITSVTRDDLPDGGALLWADTIRKIRETAPGVEVEVLVPDFKGRKESFYTVAAQRPEVFGHNLETVRRMYATARPQADYDQSLELLRWSHEAGMVTKTGIMVGLGETDDEIDQLMDDAANTGCDILYIGQYLQPSRKHLAVARYVEPDVFNDYRQKGLEKGFKVVVSAPLVRSSYHAEEQSEYVAGRAAHGPSR
jgi:lipoic acid synthetase